MQYDNIMYNLKQVTLSIIETCPSLHMWFSKGTMCFDNYSMKVTGEHYNSCRRVVLLYSICVCWQTDR